MNRFWVSTLGLLLAVGCGDSGTSGSGGAGGTGAGNAGGSGGAGAGNEGGAGGSAELHGPCPLDKRVGRFLVQAQIDFGVVTGSVATGVVPTSIPELIKEEGACKVLKRRNLVCDPACVGAETCGEDGQCLPYPLQISVGTVTIEGLTKPATMEPTQPGNTYFAPDAENPPFTPGANIELSATGGADHSAFKLYGVGSDRLTEAPEWTVEEGKPLALTWAAPSTNVGTEMSVELSIDQHGQSPLSLLCTFPDTGSAEIPAATIDTLIGAGVTGFPNGKITRRTVDSVEEDGLCTELIVGSPMAAKVEVAGYTPCDAPSDCPPEAPNCNLKLQRCEE